MLFFSAVAAQCRADGSAFLVGKSSLPSRAEVVLNLVVKYVGKPQPVEAAVWWQAPTVGAVVAGLAVVVACQLNGCMAIISLLIAIVSCSFAYREFVRPLKWCKGKIDLDKHQELSCNRGPPPLLIQRRLDFAECAPSFIGCCETEQEKSLCEARAIVSVEADQIESCRPGLHVESQALYVIDEVTMETTDSCKEDCKEDTSRMYNSGLGFESEDLYVSQITATEHVDSPDCFKDSIASSDEQDDCQHVDPAEAVDSNKQSSDSHNHSMETIAPQSELEDSSLEVVAVHVEVAEDSLNDLRDSNTHSLETIALHGECNDFSNEAPPLHIDAIEAVDSHKELSHSHTHSLEPIALRGECNDFSSEAIPLRINAVEAVDSDNRSIEIVASLGERDVACSEAMTSHIDSVEAAHSHKELSGCDDCVVKTVASECASEDSSIRAFPLHVDDREVVNSHKELFDSNNNSLGIVASLCECEDASIGTIKSMENQQVEEEVIDSASEVSSIQDISEPFDSQTELHPEEESQLRSLDVKSERLKPPKVNLVEKQLSIASINKFDSKISHVGPLPTQRLDDDTRDFVTPRKVSCPPLKVALLVAPRREALGGNSEQRLRPRSAHLARESRPTPTRGMLVQMQQQAASSMKECLASCEVELRRLSRCLDEHQYAPPGRKYLVNFDSFKSECQTLVDRLERLTEDALESGCRRDAFGAMDVFGEATAALESVAGLMRRFSTIEEEYAAPGCADPVEWGIMSEILSTGELMQLRELMQEVQTASNHPACRGFNKEPSRLLRFLRAKNGEVKAAAEMFRKSLDWRAESCIEEKHALWKEEEAAGLTQRVTLMNRFKVHQTLGRDRYGIPVLLFRWSVFDVVGAERELGTALVVQIMLSLHEDIAGEIQRVARRRHQIVPGAFSIWDIGNYGKVPHWWSRMLALARFLPKVASILESNYPELVRKVVVVRCGAATKALVHAVTPLMPASTFSKCHFCGWRSSEWQSTIREEAPDIDLPLFLASDAKVDLESASPEGGIWPVTSA